MASNTTEKHNSSIMAHAEAKEEEDEEEQVCLLAIQLASASILPMALRAAIELDLLELIKKSEPVSASELASRLPTRNPNAASMIDRILRLLAANSVLTCTRGGSERRYGLGPVCRYLTRNEDGVSVATCYSLLTQDKVFMETWYHLKDAVLEGGIPFNRAHGMSAFEYPAIDPRFNNVFNRGMFEQSTIFMKKILEKYRGFEGLNTLVDVGGGIGASLKMILSKYPSIKGINFDLPHVIQDATPSHGMEHIGGNMFISVPKAEAIFMKWILHDWGDDDCKKVLKNCYEALPENGKVIVAEGIFPEDPGSGSAYACMAQADVLMLSLNPGGKERTEKEFRELAEYAGFKRFIKVCSVYQIWIMEFHK